MSGIRINSNSSSLTAQRRLRETSSAFEAGLERLASGMRINRAADDAAGLAIAESLRADSRVYTQAMRNINDGLSLLSIAEGALTELSHIAIRQRELATQAANGTYTVKQRQALTEEANALVDEYNRIVGSVEFNGRPIFNNLEEMRIQAGYGVESSLAFTLGAQFSRSVGDGTFSSGVSFTALNGNYNVAVADYTGDGKADLVTSGVMSLSFLVGNGNGTFSAPISLETTANTYHVGAVDLNNDGKMDIAATSTSGVIAVRLGNGDGTFGATQNYSAGIVLPVYGLTVSDFNGDGNTDLATTGDDNTLSVLVGNGDGTMRARLSLPFTVPFQLASGDFNGDSRSDLLAISATTVGVFLGNGDGKFGAALNFTATGTVRGVSVGDANGDGYTDLALGMTGAGDDGHYIYIANADGTFSAGASLWGGFTHNEPNFIDVNEDGHLDLVLASLGPLGVRIGNGDGTFGAVRTYTGSGASNMRGATAADLNNDGALDLAVGRADSMSLSIFLADQIDTNTIAHMNLNTAANARVALGQIDETLNGINRELGAIGAMQSRLAVALANLGVIRENSLAAESRIRDADIAAESASLIRNSILQQVGVAVLAQANTQPTLALTLLRG